MKKINTPIQLFKVHMNPNAKVEVGKILDSGYIGQGPKVDEFENQLKENYLRTVLFQDDFIIEYKNNTFWWTKNSFLEGKNLQPIVRFEILNNNQVLYTLNNQDIFKYWGFFINSLSLNSGYYETRIIEESTNKIIYKNIIKV